MQMPLQRRRMCWRSEEEAPVVTVTVTVMSLFLSHTHRASMMPLIQPMGWPLTLRLRRDGQIDLCILDSQKLRCQGEKIISQLRIHFAAPSSLIPIFIISKSGRNQHLQHPPEPSLVLIPCTRIKSWSGFFCVLEMIDFGWIPSFLLLFFRISTLGCCFLLFVHR